MYSFDGTKGQKVVGEERGSSPNSFVRAASSTPPTARDVGLRRASIRRTLAGGTAARRFRRPGATGSCVTYGASAAARQLTLWDADARAEGAARIPDGEQWWSDSRSARPCTTHGKRPDVYVSTTRRSRAPAILGVEHVRRPAADVPPVGARAVPATRRSSGSRRRRAVTASAPPGRRRRARDCSAAPRWSRPRSRTGSAAGDGSGLRGHALIDAIVAVGRHFPGMSAARLTVLWYLVPASGAASWIATGLRGAGQPLRRAVVAVVAAVRDVGVDGRVRMARRLLAPRRRARGSRSPAPPRSSSDRGSSRRAAPPPTHRSEWPTGAGSSVVRAGDS